MKKSEARAKSKKQPVEPTADQRETIDLLVEEIKDSSNIFIANSDNLIALMHNLKVENNGFEVLGVKRWGEFFKKHIPQTSYSTATLYHFGETVDFFANHKIKPGNKTTPSVRAICSIRKKDREQIWKNSKALSESDIPPPEYIKQAHATLKGSSQPAKRKSAKAIMREVENCSATELKQFQTKIQEIIEALHSDDLGLRSISLEELQKLEALITDKVKEKSE